MPTNYAICSFKFPHAMMSATYISATPLGRHCKGCHVIRVENVPELVFDYDLWEEQPPMYHWYQLPVFSVDLVSVFILLVHV